MSIISNTTVISNFASIGQLALLRCLYGKLFISTEVYAEIQVGIEEGYHFYEGFEQQIYPSTANGWIWLTSLTADQELQFFTRVPPRLHRGEASCLAIAYHRSWLFLTDDRAARIEAQKQAIRVSGSIGSLVLSVERGICSLEEANKWLQMMLEMGYHSPVSDLTELIKAKS